MPQLTTETILLVVAVALFTGIAAATDLRSRKIPNWLTAPVFVAGILFQLAFNGWTGLGDAAAGFAVGFSPLFVLWLVGSGGGGDVKLMGALSVWLGFWNTFAVLVLSTVFVAVGSLGTIAFNMVTRGVYRTKEQLTPTRRVTKAGRDISPKSSDRKKRRIMAYAAPVALATWVVLFWTVVKTHA